MNARLSAAWFRPAISATRSANALDEAGRNQPAVRHPPSPSGKRASPKPSFIASLSAARPAAPGADQPEKLHLPETRQLGASRHIGQRTSACRDRQMPPPVRRSGSHPRRRVNIMLAEHAATRLSARAPSQAPLCSQPTTRTTPAFQRCRCHQGLNFDQKRAHALHAGEHRRTGNAGIARAKKPSAGGFGTSMRPRRPSRTRRSRRSRQSGSSPRAGCEMMRRHHPRNP